MYLKKKSIYIYKLYDCNIASILFIEWIDALCNAFKEEFFTTKSIIDNSGMKG